jgi:hypothetical protein
MPLSRPCNEDDMPGVFEVKDASAGQFMFTLETDDGAIIFTSESFVLKASAKRAIAAVRFSATIASRYERRTSRDGQHYFVLKAGNGEPLGRSAMYASIDGMEPGIASLRTHAPVAVIKDLTQDR